MRGVGVDTLRTERLIIRPFALDDLPAVHQLLDLDIEWAGPGISLAERKTRLQREVALAGWQVTRGTYGDRGLMLIETGELIGICGFRPWLLTPAERALYDPAVMALDHPFAAPELGVGFALSSKHRRRGYAAEAVRALIGYAFEELHVRRVVSLTERGNHEALALMRRVGMRVGINPDPDAIYPWGVGMIENALASPASA